MVTVIIVVKSKGSYHRPYEEGRGNLPRRGDDEVMANSGIH